MYVLCHRLWQIILLIGWLINNKNSISHPSGGWEIQKAGYLQIRYSWKLTHHKALSSHCAPHMAEGAGEPSGVSFTEALICSWGLYPCDLIIVQMPHPNTVTLAVRISNTWIPKSGHRSLWTIAIQKVFNTNVLDTFQVAKRKVGQRYATIFSSTQNWDNFLMGAHCSFELEQII